MATLFVDFENGNDSYGGTSFAPLASGTDGRISGTTFSSAGASFPDDGSLIGQYLSIYNGSAYTVYSITARVSSTSLTIAAIIGGSALSNQTLDRQYYIGGRWKKLPTSVQVVPGDTVRMMGSPEPTSLGINGLWTSQILQATKNITGATNATPISITCTGHGYSTGDTVVITGVNGNTNANGTWEITRTGDNTFTLDNSVGNGNYTSGGTARLRNNTRVILASALTQNIASTGPGRAAWTAVAGGNVTTSFNTTTKEHYQSDSIAITAGFTTGLAAYWPTVTPLNLSGYQQVSFWIQQTTGTVGASGAIDLRLCSDNAGTTSVNIISIPNLAVLSQWMPVTVDLGTNLGSSIGSIALYVNTDNGPQTFLLSNIIACKASSEPNSLTLTSLIGKNTTGETFWGIQSINGTRVMLDADANATPTTSNLRGYYGTSGTVTTYKRETIKLGPAPSSTTSLQTFPKSGGIGSPITYSGGWNRTDMSTQDLETWLDGCNGLGYLISLSSLLWINLDTVAFTRSSVGIYAPTASYCNFNVVAANNNTSSLGALYTNNHLSTDITLGHAVANNSTGSTFGAVTGTGSGTFTLNHAIASNGLNGISCGISGGSTTLQRGSGSGKISNNGSSALLIASGAPKLIGLQFADNAGDVTLQNNSGHGTVLVNCLLSSSTEVSTGGQSGVFSHNHDNTLDNHKIFYSYGLILSATDERHTASGLSWKMQPTSSVNANSRSPLTLSLAKVACNSNSLVTVKAWMRRSNTALTMRLVCKGGQIAGVASDVVSAMTANANTWEELTITFTPTEIGVVEIVSEAWGGTTYSGWVDDMTITQN